jgi:hypothetical protein
VDKSNTICDNSEEVMHLIYYYKAANLIRWKQVRYIVQLHSHHSFQSGTFRPNLSECY